MSDVPWKTVRLEDCVAEDRPICYGILMPGRGHPGGIPVIKVKDIKGGRVLLDDILLTSPQIDAQYRRSRVRAGDILLTIRGTTGRVARVPPSLDSANITQDTARITPNPNIYGNFLFFALQSDDLQSQIQHNTRGQAVKGINIADVRLLQVPLPPLGEQRKIAAILSAVDDAIEATQAVIDQLQVVKKVMITELLTRGLPGRHTRFKQTEIGKVPHEWEVVLLGDLIAEGPDNGLYKPLSDYGDGVPIVRIDTFDNGDVVKGGGLRRVRASRDEISRFGLRAGDILVNRVNSLSHIAKAAFVGDLAETTLFESNMMRFAVRTHRITPGYAFRVISSPAAKSYFVGRAKQAVAQASVNQGDVRSLPIPLPPRDEQIEIESVTDTLETRFATETTYFDELTRFKNALMSVLLTGELRVAPDEVVA